MILKDLILKYEFDTIVPDLIGIEAPVKNNLYAFKEAFDTLRRMTPGDAEGEQIAVGNIAIWSKLLLSPPTSNKYLPFTRKSPLGGICTVPTDAHWCTDKPRKSPEP